MRRAGLALIAVLACGRAEIYGERVAPKTAGGSGTAGGKATAGGAAGGRAGGSGLAGGRAGGSTAGGATAGGAAGGFIDGGSGCRPPLGTPCGFTNPPQSFMCVPGLRVIAHDTSMTGRDRWVLGFQQPVDHDQPNGAQFEQRLWLFHNGADKPMILHATGYEVFESLDELQARFDVNELSIEHRFFGTSYPVGGRFDYRKLDIRQASFDLHRIRLAFASLYAKPWVTTGASKGGMTMVYYRRYFPCDVAGTVAYVAPLMGIEEDLGIPAYISNIGGAAQLDCRNRIINLQRQLLMRQAVIEPQVRSDGGYTIQGSPQLAYENGVVSIAHGFWQYLDPTFCSLLPMGAASDTELLMWANLFIGGSDEELLPFAAFYYQAATEMGYTKAYTAPLIGLVTQPDAGGARRFVPRSITVPPFDPQPMREVQGWLADAGEGVIFVYGEFDPWSGSMYALGNARDSQRSIAPGANHGADMRALVFTDQEAAMTRVERWLGVRRTNLQSLQPSLPSESPNLRVPPLFRASRRLSPACHP